MNVADEGCDSGFGHRPVLLEEALQAMNINPAGRYIDATFGRGGHSAAILQRLDPQGRLLAIDKDLQALDVAREKFSDDPRFSILHGSFADIGALLKRSELAPKVDGVLLDLGVSSPQLDDPQRGFSFLRDGPLDMRMDTSCGLSAAQWLEQAQESEVMTVLRNYGEERFARRIARAIVAEQAQTPITTTARLAEIITAANPKWERHKHPATRSFQAIRIFINRELEDLQCCLDQVVELLAQDGRLAVISFHSLEDRMVKRFIRDQGRGELYPEGLPVTVDQLNIKLRPLGRAIKAGAAEVAANPRARSAVLRVAERL